MAVSGRNMKRVVYKILFYNKFIDMFDGYLIQLMSANTTRFHTPETLNYFCKGGGCINYTENIKGSPYKIDLPRECPEFVQPCFGMQHARKGNLSTRCLTINTV